MAVNVNLITYNGKTVTPRTDGIIYDSAIGQCGIFYGCNVSVNGNTIYVTGGYGMIRGRYFEVDESSIDVTLAPTGSVLGRLYMRLDLSNTSDPLQMLVATGPSLPDLTQEEDANYINGTWEMELATFTVTSTEVTDVVETYETITDNGTLINALQTAVDTLNSNVLDTFRVRTFGITNVSISANSNATASADYELPEGFTSLSVLGVRIDTEGTSSGVNAHACYAYNFYASGGKVNARIRNIGSATAKISAHIIVLFKRTSLD